MRFGEALEILRNGGRVTRKAWLGRKANMWIQLKDDRLKYRYASGGVSEWTPRRDEDLLGEDWMEVE